MKKNSYIFKVLLIVLFMCILMLNACTNNIPSSETQKHSSDKPGIDTSDQQDNDKVKVYDEDITIQYVTGGLIRQYKPKKIINIPSNTNGGESIVIMISANVNLNTLTISELSWTQGKFELGEVLFEKESMSTDEVIFIRIPIEGIMNFKSISYSNTEGKQINLFIHKKDIDGALFIGKY